MKTKSTYFPGIKEILLVIALFSTLTTPSKAQSNETLPAKKESHFLKLNSVAGMVSVSGNSFGVRYSPTVGFRLGRKSTLSAGPVLRMDKPYFAGYLIKGRFSLMNADNSFSGRTFLYAYGSYERNINQYFSKSWNDIEVLVSRNKYQGVVDFQDLRFNGFEVSGGFGLGHQFNKTFSLNMEFGVAVYKTNRLNYKEIKLYYQPTGFSLHLALTARFNIFRD